MGKLGKVFISYRRDSGAELARNIRDALQKRKFEVFMDVEDLRGGSFNKALYLQIETSSDVVVVLTPGSLDRCFDNPNDWVRLEVVHALKCKKNVVPILHRDFKWPSRELPGELSTLNELNGLSSSHEYFEASMDRLASKFLVGSVSKRFKSKIIQFVVTFIFLITAFCILYFKFYHNQADSTSSIPTNNKETIMPSQPLDQQIDIFSKDVKKSQKPPTTNSNLSAEPIVTKLLGSWNWSDDIETFSSDGKGTYWRDDTICFTFTYSLKNNRLRIVADYEHYCGGEDESYLIEFKGDILKQKHIGSGFTTEWRKVP